MKNVFQCMTEVLKNLNSRLIHDVTFSIAYPELARRDADGQPAYHVSEDSAAQFENFLQQYSVEVRLGEKAMAFQFITPELLQAKAVVHSGHPQHFPGHTHISFLMAINQEGKLDFNRDLANTTLRQLQQRARVPEHHSLPQHLHDPRFRPWWPTRNLHPSVAMPVSQPPVPDHSYANLNHLRNMFILRLSVAQMFHLVESNIRDIYARRSGDHIRFRKALIDLGLPTFPTQIATEDALPAVKPLMSWAGLSVQRWAEWDGQRMGDQEFTETHRQLVVLMQYLFSIENVTDRDYIKYFHPRNLVLALGGQLADVSEIDSLVATISEEALRGLKTFTGTQLSEYRKALSDMRIKSSPTMVMCTMLDNSAVIKQLAARLVAEIANMEKMPGHTSNSTIDPGVIVRTAEDVVLMFLHLVLNSLKATISKLYQEVTTTSVSNFTLTAAIAQVDKDAVSEGLQVASNGFGAPTEPTTFEKAASEGLQSSADAFGKVKQEGYLKDFVNNTNLKGVDWADVALELEKLKQARNSNPHAPATDWLAELVYRYGVDLPNAAYPGVLARELKAVFWALEDTPARLEAHSPSAIAIPRVKSMYMRPMIQSAIEAYDLAIQLDDQPSELRRVTAYWFRMQVLRHVIPRPADPLEHDTLPEVMNLCGTALDSALLREDQRMAADRDEPGARRAHYDLPDEVLVRVSKEIFASYQEIVRLAEAGNAQKATLPTSPGADSGFGIDRYGHYISLMDKQEAARVNTLLAFANVKAEMLCELHGHLKDEDPRRQEVFAKLVAAGAAFNPIGADGVLTLRYLTAPWEIGEKLNRDHQKVGHLYDQALLELTQGLRDILDYDPEMKEDECFVEDYSVVLEALEKELSLPRWAVANAMATVDTVSNRYKEIMSDRNTARSLNLRMMRAGVQTEDGEYKLVLQFPDIKALYLGYAERTVGRQDYTDENCSKAIDLAVLGIAARATALLNQLPMFIEFDQQILDECLIDDDAQDNLKRVVKSYAVFKNSARWVSDLPNVHPQAIEFLKKVHGVTVDRENHEVTIKLPQQDIRGITHDANGKVSSQVVASRALALLANLQIRVNGEGNAAQQSGSGGPVMTNQASDTIWFDKLWDRDAYGTYVGFNPRRDASTFPHPRHHPVYEEEIKATMGDPLNGQGLCNQEQVLRFIDVIETTSVITLRDGTTYYGCKMLRSAFGEPSVLTAGEYRLLRTAGIEVEDVAPYLHAIHEAVVEMTRFHFHKEQKVVKVIQTALAQAVFEKNQTIPNAAPDFTIEEREEIVQKTEADDTTFALKEVPSFLDQVNAHLYTPDKTSWEARLLPDCDMP